MFRKVLIANRGEIAVRIARTLQQMGITAVAVYSEADQHALHVACADEAYGLEGHTSAETYLRGDKIVELARAYQADAVHPGYGFLAENADFAQACVEAGLTFIGPDPDVIRAMGDKIVARQMMREAGVATVPGWSDPQGTTAATFQEQANRLGYPVVLKAAAGGGGKGMRVVQREDELLPALEAARRESENAFGDGRLFMEKYIARPRHVEIQIIADHHGHMVHLFERECSIQRRHQKIIEESPSPALSPTLREQMADAALRVARTLKYNNAGTVEFILDESDNFYFLEVNTRLQVEHPVTELILQADLVRSQVEIAAGQALAIRQKDLQPRGHALECRIYAEDAAQQFLPSTGVVEHYQAPRGPGVRVDSGVQRGSEISVHYDPMLAKLIVWGSNREEALDRMAWALGRFVVMGVTTNIEFLQHVIAHPQFRAGLVHTHFLEEHNVACSVQRSASDEVLLAAAFAALGTSDSYSPGRLERRAAEAAHNPWHTAGAWRAGR